MKGTSRGKLKLPSLDNISTKFEINKSSRLIIDITEKFLKMQNIYPGETFGFQDILFDNQPNMQLISNGCECILISKDFFIQNSTIDYLQSLRKLISPFPELKDLEINYTKHMRLKRFSDLTLYHT